MSTGRRATRLAVTFLLGSATSKVLVFALLPLYTRVLSPEAYGYYDLSITYVTIVASILFLDVWVGTMRFMYRSQSDAGRLIAVKSGILILLVSIVSFSAVALVVGAIVALPYLPLIVAYGISMNVREFFGFVARGFDRNLAYSASGAANTVVMVSLNLLLLLVFLWDLSALYVAAIVGNVLQIVWLEVVTKAVRTTLRQPVSWTDIAAMLRFVLPLGLNSVAYWLLTGIGKLVVQSEMTLTDNGYYGIGSRFGALVVVLAGVFTMVWQDLSFARGQHSDPKFFGRASSFYVAFIGFGLACIIPIAGLAFPLLVGREFSAVFELLPPFLLVAALGAFSTFLGNTFYALNRTAVVLCSTIIGTGAAIILSAPMVSIWGITGANAAAVLGFLVIIGIRLVVLGRRASIHIRIRDVSLGVILTSGGVGVYYLDIPPVSFGFPFAALAAFLFFCRSDILKAFTRSPTSA